MREIKFRGRAKMSKADLDGNCFNHDNGWVSGNFITNGNNPYIVGDLVEADPEYVIHEFWMPVYPESVGQYTGLFDKNGTEIYEGDIISVVHLMAENIPSYKAVVEWDKARYVEKAISGNNYFKFPHITPHGIIGPYNTLSTFGKQVEVIGNIYENPELLENER